MRIVALSILISLGVSCSSEPDTPPLQSDNSMTVETKIFDNEDGRHCLTVMDGSSQTIDTFEELELQGGGYTWEGVLHGLVSLRLSESSSAFDIGAESDNAYVYSKDEAALRSLQEHVMSADSDTTLLRAAIDAAGEDIE